jgi:hypothetical protein
MEAAIMLLVVGFIGAVIRLRASAPMTPQRVHTIRGPKVGIQHEEEDMRIKTF